MRKENIKGMVEELALTRAIDIGDRIINHSVSTTQGITWVIKPKITSNELNWKSPESIIAGTSGVLLFLLRLYQDTGYSRYLEAVQKGVSHLLSYCQESTSSNYALLTGKGGVVLVLLQLYKITHLPEYFEYALRIISSAKNGFLTSAYVADSLFDGRAGVLHLLHQLYQVERNEELLYDIDLFSNKIIENATAAVNGAGICWKRPESFSIRPLCSLGYGTAGIGYVFSELGCSLGDKSYDYVAQLSFQYESTCWDEALQNWPDFRKDIISPAHYDQFRKTYLENNTAFFTQPANNFSLAHGTAGLGMVRLRSFQLCPSSSKKSELEKVIEILSRALSAGEITNTDLYSGLPGIGLFFINAFQTFHQENLLDIAKNIAVYLMSKEKKDEGNEDLLGAAGRGYFYSKLAKPFGLKHSFFTLPDKQLTEEYSSEQKRTAITIDKINRALVGRSFKRTIRGVEEGQTNLNLSGFFSSEENGNKPDSFVKYVSNCLPVIKGNGDDENLLLSFQLEKTKWEMEKAIESPPLLFIEEVFRYEKSIKVLNESDEWLVQQSFRVLDTLVFVSSPQNSGNSLDNSSNSYKESKTLQAVGNKTLLLYDSKEGVVEHTLDMTSIILQLFLSTKSISVAIEEMIMFCKAQNENDLLRIVEITGSKSVDDFLSRLDSLVLFTVRQFISQGLLFHENLVE